MDTDQLKRKLRDLKKVEERIRFSDGPVRADKRVGFVWSLFFSTKDTGGGYVRYPLQILAAMDRERFKEVVEEYFYSVYFQKYKECGIKPKDIYDPGLLSILGLQPGSSFNDVKARFRELAKKYHPDRGGDAEKMIEILEAYHRLMEN